MKKRNHRDLYFLIISVALFLIGGGVAFFIKGWVKEVFLLPVIDALWWLYLIVDSLPQLFLWFFFLALGSLFVLMIMARSIVDEFDLLKNRKKLTPINYMSDITHLRKIDPSNPYLQQRLARHLAEMYFEAIGIQSPRAQRMREELLQKTNQLPREVMEVFQFGLQGNRRFYLAEARWYFVQRLTSYLRLPWLQMLRNFFLRIPRSKRMLNFDAPNTEEYRTPEENEIPPQSFFEKTLFFIEQQLFMHCNN